MNNHSALWRSGRVRVPSLLLGLSVAVASTGCAPSADTSSIPPYYFGLRDAAIGSDGTLHVTARVDSSFDTSDEPGITILGYAYLRSHGGKVETSSTPLGAGDAFTTDVVYRMVLDGQGRPVIAAEGSQGLLVQVLDGAIWKTVLPDPALSLKAAAGLKVPGKLGGAWVDSSGAVRVMYGTYVYTVGESLSSEVAIGVACPIVEDCSFSPQADVAGQAAQGYREIDTYKLHQLDCDGACNWHDVGTLGATHGAENESFGNIFFHTSDGTPTLVRESFDDVQLQWSLIATTPAAQTTLFFGHNDEFGAAPRPGGGFVAVGRDLDKHLLQAAFVGADGAMKLIVLGDQDDFVGQPIRVMVTTDGGERAHVVFRQSYDQISHVTVDEDGNYDREYLRFVWDAPE